ncbi:MAG: ABC transporter transmembrane domain-containing protein [Nitrospinota bacterium]|nr:ABC transporter transmembrane domain-containing protein [Nitrospinota bacterium]
MKKRFVLKNLFFYLKSYKVRFGVAVLCTLVVATLNAFPALLVKYAVDDVLISKNMQMAIFLSVALISIYLLKGTFSYFQSYFMEWVGHRVVVDVRSRLHSHMMSLPIHFFEQKTTGELMSKVLFDISLMQKAVSSSLRDLARYFFTFIALLVVAIYQSPKMSFFFVIAVPPISLIVFRLGEKIRRATRGNQERMGDISSLMKETYSGIKEVKAYGAEKIEEARFDKSNFSFFVNMKKVLRVRALAPPLVEAIGGVIAAVVLWFGSMMVINGEITPGEFSSFLVAVGMIYSPLKSLTRVYNNMMEGVAGGQSVFELIDNELSEEVVIKSRKMGKLTDGIKIQNVSFEYGSVPVLRDINFEIKCGSLVAFVGLSGAGKTTLLDLIPQFYLPSSGKILFDGVDARELDIRSIRKQIAMVAQQVFIFNDTVEKNISYGFKEEPNFEDIVSAAKAANADSFIKAMPDGYNTILGEDGVRISGGERQRIAIARAILRNPSILLLDEATSALDSENESLIQEALDRLMKGRTTLVISHRFSAVQHADEIVVLKDGSIVEQGVHNELIQLNGHYKKLYEMQVEDTRS